MNKLKLLKVGDCYRLKEIEPIKLDVIYDDDDDGAWFLETGDIFLVLESRSRFRHVTKITQGQTIYNKILINNRVCSFWYWCDSDFYLEIEKYLKKFVS